MSVVYAVLILAVAFSIIAMFAGTQGLETYLVNMGFLPR